MAQSVKCSTLGFGSDHDLMVHGIEPDVGLCADNMEIKRNALCCSRVHFLFYQRWRQVCSLWYDVEENISSCNSSKKEDCMKGSSFCQRQTRLMLLPIDVNPSRPFHARAVCVWTVSTYIWCQNSKVPKKHSVREVAFPHPSYPQLRSSLGNVYQRIYLSPLVRLEMVSNVLLLLKIL